MVGFGATNAFSVKPKPKPKATPQIVVTASPNPAVETGTSNVDSVIQVESNPSNAGSLVTISSTQFTAHCPGAANNPIYVTILNGTPLAPITGTNSITVPLDNDGNATVGVDALNCAPGSVLIDASLDAPPFSTAVTKLIIVPPQVTPPGVHGFPANEVETGDGGTGMGPFGASDVYAVFLVETSPVYAEQMATITSDQLTQRCGLGFGWFDSGSFPAVVVSGANGSTGPGSSGNVVEQPIDNDGNAEFQFFGASCAAGKSTVIAEILAGGPTYSTQYNILPPAVTI
jgi:hypothetical protein